MHYRYDGDNYIRQMKGNYVIEELTNRTDYSYNTTVLQVYLHIYIDIFNVLCIYRYTNIAQLYMHVHCTYTCMYMHVI